MAGDEDVARIMRLKRGSEFKRMNYVKRIRAVHRVALQSAEDTSVVPQLLVMVKSLDQLLTSFTVEDEALLEHLLDLDLDNEYPDTEGVEMFELVSFAKATATRYMQYCPDQTIVSIHSGSQVPLNDVDGSVPKADEPVIPDNVGVNVSPGDVRSNSVDSLRSRSVQVVKPTRLPEIPLPTYEGDIYEWIAFRDRFITTVDRLEYLSDIDKFYYLVGCCRGAARDAIRGIPVSDHNYKLAWSTLEERFNKPRLVACSLIEKLLNAPRASSESLVELNKLLVLFDEGVSLLESLNIPNLGDFILFSITSRCLPIYSIKLFEAQLAHGFPTVQDLLRFVKSCVAILVMHSMRALIDSASQISAITLECQNRLGLRMQKWTAPVTGIGGVSVQNVLGIVHCQAQPRFSPDPVLNFDAWVFPSITAEMPRHPLPRWIADKYQHLALADPSFTNPGTIDVLLGADLFAQILNGKRVSVGDAFPVAFGTVFGWTVIGPVPISTSNVSVSCHASLTASIETLPERYWELKEPDAAPEEFTQEGQYEAIFRDSCTHDSSGRFCVPLVFHQAVSFDTFRGSHAVADKRFQHLEKKLANDPRLRRLYCEFMSEYLTLGHMSPATTSDGDYFIPHHAVYRPIDIEPKIRVVFDAATTSYSGVSLNDCVLPGPKLQRDVVDVLLLYRVHRFAFTTDISKMYRQVSVSPSHRRDQLTASVHCTWQFNPPGAPHFGGLWGAAVRSSKSLLMRILGEHTFTIEEFGTVLCRCEAILNSRPITPAELDCLTPGHFLIGRPLFAVPEADIPITTRTLEQRWKLVSQCVQAFWRRWRNEYLQTLQIRSRWTKDAPNISVDDMAVIKVAHTPPLKWRMGRVIEVLPGSAKVVRVVRLRAATCIVTRPVIKVVKLLDQP